jgi:signal transduction histidine kinase
MPNISSSTGSTIIGELRVGGARGPVGDARLDRILTANVALEFLVATCVTIVWVAAVRSPWVLLIVLAVLGYAACVWRGRTMNRRGRVTAAIVWASVGFIPVGIVNAIVAPFSLPLLVLAILLPGLMGVSYLSQRAMAALTIGCVAGTLAFCAVASWSPVTAITDEVPTPMRSAILILGVPAIAAMLVFVEWQSHTEMSSRTELVGRSRRRLLDGAVAGRNRLERQLRGGVQERLRAARFGIERAERDAARDRTAEAAAALLVASSELDRAIDELRALARGLYPASVSTKGLTSALPGLVASTGLHASLEVEAEGLDVELAQAVYACCAEALDNVAMHAGTGVQVVLEVQVAGDSVSFVVADDGVGFDPATTPRGDGLELAGDRVLALGGSLDVWSAPGRGTTVSGVIPLVGHDRRERDEVVIVEMVSDRG